MEKGDILSSSKTNHPIIFIKWINEDQFAGNLITHSKTDDYPDNIGLSKEHFENRKEYSVKFDNSYFVSISSIKKDDWGPFKIVGKLTNKGIEFIQKFLSSREPIFWDDYIAE